LSVIGTLTRLVRACSGSLPRGALQFSQMFLPTA
jgi:hypothetical protein